MAQKGKWHFCNSAANGTSQPGVSSQSENPKVIAKQNEHLTFFQVPVRRKLAWSCFMIKSTSLIFKRFYSHPCLPCSWTFTELLCLKKHLQEGKGYTNSLTIVSALLYNTWQVVDSPLCQNFIKSWESGSTQESTSIDFLGTSIIMGSKSIVSSQSPQIMLCMPSIHLTPIHIQHHGSTYVDTKTLLQVEALAWGHSYELSTPGVEELKVLQLSSTSTGLEMQLWHWAQLDLLNFPPLNLASRALRAP